MDSTAPLMTTLGQVYSMGSSRRHFDSCSLLIVIPTGCARRGAVELGQIVRLKLAYSKPLPTGTRAAFSNTASLSSTPSSLSC